MRAALYVRVSMERQQQAQTIEQQVAALRTYLAERPDWVVAPDRLFRDDGHSGAKLERPGLDALRDQAARAAFDVVLITAPDRLGSRGAGNPRMLSAARPLPHALPITTRSTDPRNRAFNMTYTPSDNRGTIRFPCSKV